MMDVNELTGLMRFGWDWIGSEGQFVVWAGAIALIVGLVWQLSQALAMRRFASVLDLYAERQMAKNVRVDRAHRRSGTVALASPRRSGVVAVVQG